MGLLLPHKSTIRLYSDMLTVAPVEDRQQAGGGKRGKVQVFSAESRYRLFRLLHQLEFKTVTFCTLTYPKDFPTESKVYKAHLKEYRRRFERNWGKIRAVWRLEFQKRGAPHYHIMYLDAAHVPIGEWCGLWSDVIHTDDENHRKIGVDVKLVAQGKEGKLVASYLAKYVAKEDKSHVNESPNYVGRYWGKWNIEEEAPITVEVWSTQVYGIVVDCLDVWRGDGTWRPTNLDACSVFGNSMGSGNFRDRGLEYLEERGIKSRS